MQKVEDKKEEDNKKNYFCLIGHAGKNYKPQKVDLLGMYCIGRYMGTSY
jgi:hypothetical protein